MFFPLFATIAALAPFTGATAAVDPLSITEAQRAATMGTHGFSYDFIEADLVLGGDLIGPRFRISKPFQHDLFWTGSFTCLTGDIGSTDFDMRSLTGGVTYVRNIPESSKNLDVFASAELELVQTDATVSGASSDDTDIGLLLRGGARFQATNEIEAFGGLTLHTTGDYNDFVLEGGARLDYSDAIKLQAALEIGDEDTAITFGVRYSF